jgi:CBS domain-containing protein
MRVSEGMSTSVLTVGPGHTLREVAARMIGRNVGAAVVVDPEGEGYAILTERDVLRSVGEGEDPDTELAADHLSADLVCAAPDWSLERAADEMVHGGFRHMIVVEGGEPVGILSMRDIVRVWTEAGAIRGVPASAPSSSSG